MVAQSDSPFRTPNGYELTVKLYSHPLSQAEMWQCRVETSTASLDRSQGRERFERRQRAIVASESLKGDSIEGYGEKEQTQGNGGLEVLTQACANRLRQGCRDLACRAVNR